MGLYTMLIKNLPVIMVITVFMATILTNITLKNIYVKTMIMIKKTRSSSLLLLFLLAGCSLSPGMHMNTSSDFGSSKNYVFIESLDKRVEIENIKDNFSFDKTSDITYRIGNGDQISIQFGVYLKFFHFQVLVLI